MSGWAGVKQLPPYLPKLYWDICCQRVIGVVVVTFLVGLLVTLVWCDPPIRVCCDLSSSLLHTYITCSVQGYVRVVLLGGVYIFGDRQRWTGRDRSGESNTHYIIPGLS